MTDLSKITFLITEPAWSNRRARPELFAEDHPTLQDFSDAADFIAPFMVLDGQLLPEEEARQILENLTIEDLRVLVQRFVAAVERRHRVN